MLSSLSLETASRNYSLFASESRRYITGIESNRQIRCSNTAQTNPNDARKPNWRFTRRARMKPNMIAVRSTRLTHNEIAVFITPAYHRRTVAGNDFSRAERIAVWAASTSAVSRVFSGLR